MTTVDSRRRIRVALETLGCKVNAVDGEQLLRRLEAQNGVQVERVPFKELADLYIINSCTVTAAADRQTRQLIYQARRRAPGAQVVLTGCLARVAPDITGQIPELDAVFSLQDHAELARFAAEVALSAAPQETQGAEAPSNTIRGQARERPFLKIQDGCDSFCTYCIVPKARGPSRSVTPHEVAARLQELARSGFAEVVLTGIHLGIYGLDLAPPHSLASLIERLLGVVPRLRLSSIEPGEVDEGLVAQMGQEGICSHLHIPIQSGSDEVLAAMGRPYTRNHAEGLLTTLRAHDPALALGTDLIAGFPGESQRRFHETLEFVARSPLTHLHVFPFSGRPGTPAAAMSGQLRVGEIKERAKILREAGGRKTALFAAAQVGGVRQVLVEAKNDRAGHLTGLTDNYLRVSFPGSPHLIGTLVHVRIERSTGPRLEGRLKDDKATVPA